MKENWKRKKVIRGTAHFKVGEVVYVRESGPKYYRVRNPRNGYASIDAGWLRERFTAIHELDEILGL